MIRLLLLLALGLAGCSGGMPGSAHHCLSRGAVPDRACTPGAFLPGLTAAQVCLPGYSASVRNVSVAEKNAVYAEYRVAQHSAGEYEIDHFISLELGGSNDRSNLWPEPAEPRPGFHEKDQVENFLHQQVCQGKLTLAQAQHEITTNWLKVYRDLQLPTRRGRESYLFGR